MGDDLFHALFKFAARQQDAPLARQTHDANVRAEPHNFPFVTAAWMGLAELHDIVQGKGERRTQGSDQ